VLVASGCDGTGCGNGFQVSQTGNARPACDSGEGTACNGASAPAVVADRAGREFAVLWEGNYDVGEHDLYGRRIDAETGEPSSDETVVATGLPGGVSPRMLAIRHPAGDGYLAVVAYHVPGSFPITWRVLSLGTRLELRESADLQVSRGRVLGALAGNEPRREALVVETAFPTDTPGPTSTGNGIRVIRLDRHGRPRGAREIGASDWEQGFAARVGAAHVPGRDEYLIARLTLAGGTARLDVAGVDGKLDTLRVAGAPAVRGTPVDLAIAHAPASGRTLLAWVEWQPDRSRHVRGAWLAADGAPGPPFAISDDVADGNPDGIGLVADAAGPDFLVSWTDGTMSGTRRHERVTAERPGEGPTVTSYEKPGSGESTDSAAASSPLGTHLAVWTQGLRDLDGRQLRARLGEL
jgi:hypothetical protein